MKKPIPPADMTDRAAVDKFLAESTEYQSHNMKAANRNLKIVMALLVLVAILHVARLVR